MNSPLSDLEFEILDRLYHADRRTLSQTDMLKPIGLRINEYSSALKVLRSNGILENTSMCYRLTDPGITAYLTEIRRRSEFSASQEKIDGLTSELAATRSALDETTQKLAAAETTLVENNARLSAAEAHAAKSDKKARLYFWGGIVATIVCTFLGWLLGKHF